MIPKKSHPITLGTLLAFALLAVSTPKNSLATDIAPQTTCAVSAAHDSVELDKKWRAADGSPLATPPTLASTVTITLTGPKSWMRVIYPAGDTANPILTSASQKPDDAGSSWPSEISATFNSATSVTANSTKELSNVVLLFDDCSQQKFDSLKGYSKNFAGTGANAGKTILGLWIKSGSNKSGDGSGYGEYLGRALMIAEGVSFTVTETGLPSGWSCKSGLGTFTSEGGISTHTVINQATQSIVPSVAIVKTAGTALDGEVYAISGAHIVTYTYTVTNTGDTWLKNFSITDDKLGDIGSLAGPIAPGASAVMTVDTMIASDVTNTGTVVATACTEAGGAVPGYTQVSDRDDAVVSILPAVEHETVTLIKEWYDGDTNRLASPPALASPVTITASNTYAWITLVFPAGNTNSPVITSAVLKPEGEGESWPTRVSATFDPAAQTVVANSTKTLSNVVLKFADGSEQKFDNLAGYSQSFAGTGVNEGKTIVGLWIKSGSNASGDGPGFGSYIAPALMIAEGDTYTVTETGLPIGWTCLSGIGSFVSNGSADTHLVKNCMPPDPEPSVRLIKKAGSAVDGETLTLDAAGSVTYSYLVQNTGNTYLKDLVVTDDKLGNIGTIAGPLAPSASATLLKETPVSATVTNIGSVAATPCYQNGTALDLPNVTDDDDAIVRLRPLSAIGDFVWLDLNANGIQDAGELGLANVTVALCDASGTQITTSSTDANGYYLFPNLLPGTYTIRFEAPNGFVISASHEGDDEAADSDAEPDTGLSQTVTLPEGTTHLTVDAGLWHPQASVSLVKTAGTAQDGDTFTITGPGAVTYTYQIQNTGNTWLQNVTVTDDKLGLIGTLQGMLAPGASTNITASTSVSATVTNIGSVSGTPATPQGDAIPGMNDVADADDAVVEVLPAGLASLGNCVWVDANTNGVQDAGELGLIGVVVTLSNEEGTNLASTVTASDGSYRFDNLPAGTYRIQFTLPSSSWIFTAQNQGGDDAVDSDADVATGRTTLITLAHGQQDLSWDAGVYGDLPPGFCSQMTVGENYNALILGNFSASGGDTEGRLAVGGNAVFNTNVGYSVGISVYGEAIPQNLTGIQDMLIVRGDLYDGLFGVNGNIVRGGTRYGPERYGNPSRQVSPFTLGDDGNVPNDGSGRSFESTFEQIRLASAMISTMANRGVTEIELDRTDHIIRFTGNDPNINIFNVNTADWNGTQIDINITAPEYSTVVFNIHGPVVELSNAAIRLFGITNDRILFNYADATSITTSGFSHEGAVLAPYANAHFSGGYFEGFGVFGGNVVTTNGFEFHHYPFRGTVCTEAENSPSIQIETTAGSAPDGTTLTVLGGSDVSLSYRVTNNGNTPLDSIKVVDSVLGQVGTLNQILEAGQSVTLTAVMANVTTDTTPIATATGRPVRTDGTILNGYPTVSDSDSAAIRIGSPSTNGGDAADTWQRADFAVTGLEFLTQPTLTGEVFSVRVTLDNHGDIAANAGRLTVYLDKPEFAAVGAVGAASVNAGVLSPGESKSFVFNLRSGAEPGIRHLRAYADSLNQVQEWSDGDNQLSDVYQLNPISLFINSVDEGMELSWNSFWGQRYTIYRCTDLSKGFLLYKSNITATPPTNTHIDAEDYPVRFYKLVVEQP